MKSNSSEIVAQLLTANHYVVILQLTDAAHWEN